MQSSAMKSGPGYTVGPIPIPRGRQVGQNLHRFRSVKAGMRTVTCESRLEADYLFALEGDPQIVWFCEQGFRIDRPIGKKPWYTLDAAVRNRDGEECLYEVKHSSQLVPTHDDVLKPANWHAVQSACSEYGREVGFVTEKDLAPIAVLIANWRTLLPHAVSAYEDPDQVLVARILSLVNGGAGISIEDACAVWPECDDDTVTAHIAMLLHSDDLDASLNDTLITPSTVVHGANREAPRMVGLFNCAPGSRSR